MKEMSLICKNTQVCFPKPRYAIRWSLSKCAESVSKHKIYHIARSYSPSKLYEHHWHWGRKPTFTVACPMLQTNNGLLQSSIESHALRINMKWEELSVVLHSTHLVKVSPETKPSKRKMLKQILFTASSWRSHLNTIFKFIWILTVRITLAINID